MLTVRPSNRGIVLLVSICLHMVPIRQNLDRIALQHPRKDWLGDDGSAGIHHIVVHHVYATAKERN